MGAEELSRLNPPQRAPLRNAWLSTITEACDHDAFVGQDAVEHRPAMLLDRSAMQVRNRDLVLLGIPGDFGDGFVDAVEEGVAEAGLARVEPVASLLKIERGERR